MQKILVWDLPIRLFHWLLMLDIIGLVVTAKLGGNAMEWHARLGYLALGLILFRLIWGVVGSYHARFGHFLRGPQAVMGYAKNLLNKNAEHYLGHNPIGGWSAVAMMASVAFQAVSGLFANDDVLLDGPYVNLIGKEMSDFITKLHKLNSDLLLILIGVHVAAIAFYYFYKKDNLVKPMVTGQKIIKNDASPTAIQPETPRPYWVFGLSVSLVGCLTYGVATRFFG